MTVKIFLGLLLAYLFYLSVMTLFQRSFIYQPDQFEIYDQTVLDQYDIGVMSVNDGQQWLYLPSKSPKQRALIYFCGNAGSAIDRVDRANIWRNHGYDVFIVEYPGYGPNKGTPSEENFYEYGRVAINKIIDDFSDREFVLYGESIGSGTAVQMAVEYSNIKALIIDSGFSSLMDVIQKQYPLIPVKYLLKDRFDNMAKINLMKGHLFVFHSFQDDLIPLGFTQKLFERYRGEKDFISFETGIHANIPVHEHINFMTNKLFP